MLAKRWWCLFDARTGLAGLGSGKLLRSRKAIDSLAEEIVFGITEVHTGSWWPRVYPFAETLFRKWRRRQEAGWPRVQGKPCSRGAIQGQLIAALEERRRIRLLDRDFQQVLKEQNLQQSGKFDETTIAAYGNFVGAQGVVTGEILNLGTGSRSRSR